MTIQNITDSEIALKAGWEQERNVSDQLARERDTLKIELSEAQAERTKYRNEYATCHAAWQLMKQERDTLQARVAELEQRIDDNIALCVKRVAEVTRERDALRAQIETVPTEVTEVAQVAIESVLREYNYPANPKNAARAGWRACRLHIAAMKGAAA